MTIRRNSSNFFKGIFRRQSFSLLIRSDLFAPRLFQNKRPELNPLDDAEINEGVSMGGHLIIDNHGMPLSIAEEVERVCSVFVSFLRLDDLLHQGGLRVLPAQQVEYTGQITQLNIELYEASNIHLSFLHVYPGIHPLEIEKHG